MNEILDRIIYTLGLINVHGAEDLSRMLGCIQGLQKIRSEANEQHSETDPVD